jgi:hypothetical protein
MNDNEIHIGQLIKKVVRMQGIKDVAFAQKIGKSRQNVYDLYNRFDVEVKLLLTISRALDYDFFQHFRLKNDEVACTDVSIQMKVKSENLNTLFKWISENSNISITKN